MTRRSSTRPDPTPATRWRREAPVQRRAHETQERFAAAAEALLQESPFEAISVQAIARRAGRPVGSFYARFASKEALLPFLYERYHEGLESLIEARVGARNWSRLGFTATIEGVVDVLLGLYDERRWLIRALALFTRQSPEALPGDLVERRRRVYDRMVAVLIRHRDHIRHPDPEAAIRFGVFMVSAVAREKLLFGDAPHSRVTPLTRRALRAELVRALRGYLSLEARS